MTTPIPFRSKSLRAIARSRGHMRQAQEEYAKGGPSKAHFAVAKANHVLTTASLKEQARVAEAEEVRAAIAVLDFDPDMLTDEDVAALETKIIVWVRSVTAEAEEDPDEQ